MCSSHTPRSECYRPVIGYLVVCVSLLEAVQQKSWYFANDSSPARPLQIYNVSDDAANVKFQRSPPSLSLLVTRRQRTRSELLRASPRLRPSQLGLPKNSSSAFEKTVWPQESLRIAAWGSEFEVKKAMSWSVLWKVLPGALLLCLAVPLLWINERRSMRVETLVTRGLAECEVIDTMAKAQEVQDGQLVCVRGRTCAKDPITDDQFMYATARNCLRLQSTIEVFEHVPVPEWITGGSSRLLPRFEKEWTPFHRNLTSEFKRQPGEAPQPPLNPDPPPGLLLGTYTADSSRVTIQSYVLPKQLLSHFMKFVPAMDHLPKVIHFDDISFHADANDGYFYARPGGSDQGSPPSGTSTPKHAQHDIGANPQVGDLRVRFLCVPEGEATVVAVQCRKDGDKTFVPYRPIARAVCLDQTEKKRQVQEGSMPLKEFLGQDVALCCFSDKGQPLIPCCVCCYPCTTMTRCCNQEVVTEEVMHVSDRHDSPEKVFRQVVPRNRCRVCLYRLAICCLMFCALKLVLSPILDVLAVRLSVSGSHAHTVIVLGATLVMSALIAATSYASYSPFAAAKYFFVAGLIFASPAILERYEAGA